MQDNNLTGNMLIKYNIKLHERSHLKISGF